MTPRFSTPSMSNSSMFTPRCASTPATAAATPVSLGTRTVSCFMAPESERVEEWNVGRRTSGSFGQFESGGSDWMSCAQCLCEVVGKLIDHRFGDVGQRDD